MKLLIAFAAGFAADLIFGDPHGLIHPVQIIGWFIDRIKRGMQRALYGCSFDEVKEKNIPRKETGELICGYILTLVIVTGTFFVIYMILLLMANMMLALSGMTVLLQILILNLKNVCYSFKMLLLVRKNLECGTLAKLIDKLKKH